MESASTTPLGMPKAIYYAGTIITFAGIIVMFILFNALQSKIDKQIQMINNSACYRDEQRGCVEECIVWSSKCDAIKAANEEGTPIPICIAMGGC